MQTPKHVLALVGVICCACSLAAAGTQRPILLPTPKKVTWLEGRITPGCVVAASEQSAVSVGVDELNRKLQSLGRPAITIIDSAMQAGGSGALLWVGTRNDLAKRGEMSLAPLRLPKEMCVPDGYVIRCDTSGGRDVVSVVGYDARGCYYGIQTLIQLMDGKGSIPRVEITDWPTFKMRLIKIDASTTDDDASWRWAWLMPRYKMNVLAAQFRPVDSGSWKHPSDTFLRNCLAIGGNSGARGTYDALVYMGPFGKDRGKLTDQHMVDDYVAAFEQRIAEGFNWLAFDFNDWGTYRSLTPEEQAKFKDVGEVMTWLTNETYNRIRAKHPEVGFASVPVVGYYGGTPKPELIYYCKNIPRDILVETTGPVTRSRNISEQWLKDWTAATGRKPFLWDNTIYAHLDQLYPIARGCYNLNAYSNTFPANMADLLAGPGIHLNGTAQPWREPGTLTFLDYMWNPEAYDPKTSLRNAQTLLWGKDAPEAADEAQRLSTELFDYLFNERPPKGKGTIEGAVAKYRAFEVAVRHLETVIGDAEVTNDLESMYLQQAVLGIKRTFPEAQNLKARFSLPETEPTK